MVSMVADNEEENRRPPLVTAIRWYRYGLWALIGATGLQLLLSVLVVQLAFLAPVGASAATALAILVALGAAALALRSMLLARSEFGRIGSTAGNVETRRSARAMRADAGPAVLVSIVTGVVILTGLLNLRAYIVAGQILDTIFGEGRAPAVEMPEVSVLNVTVIFSLILLSGAAIGLVFIFIRIRKFARAASRFADE